MSWGLVIFSVRLHFRRHWGCLCDDLFVWNREVIGFSSFICRAPHRKIFLETFLLLFIFFPVTMYLLALGAGCLSVSPWCAKLDRKYLNNRKLPGSLSQGHVQRSHPIDNGGVRASSWGGVAFPGAEAAAWGEGPIPFCSTLPAHTLLGEPHCWQVWFSHCHSQLCYPASGLNLQQLKLVFALPEALTCCSSLHPLFVPSKCHLSVSSGTVRRHFRISAFHP